MKGFCEKKFGSMLISGTFTQAVMYLMLRSTEKQHFDLVIS